MNRFTIILRVAGGHAFFRDHKNGLVAIADQSGPTPDKTDDGVLYLDTEKEVMASGTGFYLPLLADNLRRSSTIASPAEARQVCQKFKMRMSVDGVSFAVVS